MKTLFSAAVRSVMLVSPLLVGALALDPLRSCAAVEHPERYIQSRSGEIQLLPALTLEEIPRGHVSGVEAAGGFVFDLEWRENKMTKMRVFSPSGGVCRVRSYAGMGSPLLRKAKGDCPNPAIAATKAAPTDALPESCFERRKNPLSSVCFDFDTEPGETLEFKGVSGNQDWTSYAAHLSDAFLATSEAARIAQNVLDWQLKTGGWPKNVPMYEKLTPKERKAVLAMKGDRKRATIDNGATFAEMRFLARMYKATDRKEYLDGVVRGIDFLLDLQYPNGGWPQFDPSKKGYWAQITFNDGAMVNVLNLLRDVFDGRAPFDIEIPDAKRAAARDAFWKGVGCILATQVKQNGKLTVWCQQHDKETLAPCQGRAFELPALTSYESLGIVELLMSLDPADCVGKGRPDYARIEAAIEGAKEWYAKTEIRRFKFEKNYRRDDGILSRRLVPVSKAEADRLWCRYYTLDDNRPFTGTRQGEKRFTFEEMERGENTSYQWFNGSGVKMEKEYVRWQERLAKLESATLRVAAGDSLQAVLDSIPESSPRPYVVRVAPGRYREKVKLGGRRAKVGLVADDPAPGKTVISWNDTPSTPGLDGKGLGTSGSATMTVNIPDFTMEGFTVENTGTPERLAATGGKEQAGQCVALLVKGDRNVFRNCRFLGWQDTIFAGGSVGETPARQYFENCRIEGSVDFIFGGAVALFKDCEIHSVNGGFVTAGSHAAGLPFGYVFENCRVTCVEGKKTSLGRPWRPYANVTWIGCDFGDAVIPQGWSDWTTDCGKRVYRSAEYCCTSKGKTTRPAHIEVGGKDELLERLHAAGFNAVSDIIAGVDNWRP